jgi:hypothetical protein
MSSFSVAQAPVRGNIAESSILPPVPARLGSRRLKALTKTKISRTKIWLGPALPDQVKHGS